jgi:hypothetical protein
VKEINKRFGRKRKWSRRNRRKVSEGRQSTCGFTDTDSRDLDCSGRREKERERERERERDEWRAGFKRAFVLGRVCHHYRTSCRKTATGHLLAHKQRFRLIAKAAKQLEFDFWANGESTSNGAHSQLEQTPNQRQKTIRERTECWCLSLRTSDVEMRGRAQLTSVRKKRRAAEWHRPTVY